MGQLRDRIIVQSRNWLDPNAQPLPPFDYDYTYPITVFDAVKRTTADDSSNLSDELIAIYRLISEKQNIIQPGIPGNIMSWTGIKGEIGSLEVVRIINSDPAQRSHSKIPTEKAVGDLIDTRASLAVLNQHTANNSIHITDVERTRWNSMAPLTSLQAHINNTNVHVTNEERSRWNSKANQGDLDEHRYDTNNPHNVTAHQAGTYTRREIDEFFEGLRESFFNYLNIQWDDRNNVAELVKYNAANWNPNFVLGYHEPLPDVPDVAQTYFALKPITNYLYQETNDVIIYIKAPGLMWQEVGFAIMRAGDMVIKFPDTSMYVWVQGRFVQLFAGSAGDEWPGGDGINGNIWRPHYDITSGYVTWILSKEETPPEPMLIKGEDGKTPIKGIDYVDGKDGAGVPVGGVHGDILFKLSNENFDTTWKSLRELFDDLATGGWVLPDNIVHWNHIQGRPEWFNTPGQSENGFMTQKATTDLATSLQKQITEILTRLDGVGGISSIGKDLYDHINDFNNPHRVNPTQIGAVTIAAHQSHLQNFNNPHQVNKEHLGLGNVDNTSDRLKPISEAQQMALDELERLIRALQNDYDGTAYMVNCRWDRQGGHLEYTFNTGQKLNVTVPFTEVFDSMRVDPITKELIFDLPNGSIKRIDISSMIPKYLGSVGAHIQVLIENDNIVKATIIPGTITGEELISSIHLIGNPTTRTQPVGDNSTRIATTEFVKGQVINNLISYEVDRPLSANMGRILNTRKADIDEVLAIIHDLEGINVIDHLDSTSAVAALSANMGRHLDLTKAPRVHTSPSGSTFGRATISLFGHARASEVDPLMDGTVFRGTDDGYFARADHRHPTDITRAPLHSPEFTGHPKTPTPPDDSNDLSIVNTEWVRRNAVGVSLGECTTDGTVPNKIVTLRSDFMADPVFLRQTGSTVAVVFSENDESPSTVYMDVHGTGLAPIIFGGIPIINGMLKADHTHLFTFDGISWRLLNPAGIHVLPDDDNSNSFVSSQWVRRNLVGVSKGESSTSSGNANKTAKLRSTFMDPVVFMRQIGTTVAITFENEDRSGATPTTLNVQSTGAAVIIFAGAPVTQGMIGENHTHMFVFDGVNWQLINPVPGTGMGGPGGITIGPGGKPDGPVWDDTVVNRLSGHHGFTTQGDGTVDLNGQVDRVWIAVNFEPRATDVAVTFSTDEGSFAIQMGDGTSITIRDPKIIDVTRSNCTVQFTMDRVYPSNSPCVLVYRNNNAWINIKEL